MLNNEKVSGSLSQAIRDATNGIGASIVIDTTGVVSVIRDALEMTAVRGKMVLLGMSTESVDINITKFKVVCILPSLK